MIAKKEKIQYSNFKWCIDNDFQVYLVPTRNNRFKVAVRRKGITTGGKEFIYKNGVKIKSVETLSKKDYKNEYEASEYAHEVRAILKKQYG